MSATKSPEIARAEAALEAATKRLREADAANVVNTASAWLASQVRENKASVVP